MKKIFSPPILGDKYAPNDPDLYKKYTPPASGVPPVNQEQSMQELQKAGTAAETEAARRARQPHLDKIAQLKKEIDQMKGGSAKSRLQSLLEGVEKLLNPSYPTDVKSKF